MTAALVAAIAGLKVCVLERAQCVGGTSAISAGSAWVPNTHLALPGLDSEDTALRYLDATVGAHSSTEMKRAFLNAGPQMVRLLEEQSEVRFRLYPHLPDYYSEREGATTTGRALETVPFDGRKLGRHFKLVRPPLPEFTILGGMMVSRADIVNLLSAHRDGGAS